MTATHIGARGSGADGNFTRSVHIVELRRLRGVHCRRAFPHCRRVHSVDVKAMCTIGWAG